MDFISHILIGRALAVSPKNSKRDIIWITLFAFLADIPQIPLHFWLGYMKNRPFWFPYTIDWMGFRALHPYLSMFWEIPHSTLFLILIILPIVLVFKLPKMALIAYFSHIFIDVFTHTGEWSMKPFYPINYTIGGFTDAWAWSIYGLIVSWIVLIAFILIASMLSRKRKSKK